MRDIAAGALFAFSLLPTVAAAYQLMVSPHPDLEDAVPLQGARVSGPVYIFLEPPTQGTLVQFELDGKPLRVEGSKQGLALDIAARNGIAVAWNSSQSPGPHRLQARLTVTADSQPVRAQFDPHPEGDAVNVIICRTERANHKCLEVLGEFPGTGVTGNDVIAMLKPGEQLCAAAKAIRKADLQQSELGPPVCLQAPEAGTQTVSASFDSARVGPPMTLVEAHP